MNSEKGGYLTMANVMVVDDTAFMRMVLKNILEESGLKVVAEATNGKEAVKLFKQFKPDLVTMDITMPDMDGLQALREIRKTHADARVIICSAVGQRYKVIEAIHAGAKDFIVKPFLKDRILVAINKALE
jgi:two-component system, chemotaxis family, chemotaxis protein CheY